MVRRLIAYGDINMDISVKADVLPAPGQDAIVEQFALSPGGSAHNCAIVAARLGAAVEFVGVVANDVFGPLLRASLARHGVGIRYLRTVEGDSGTIIALVHSGGERSFLSFRGVNASVPYGALPPDLIGHRDCLHLSGYSFQAGHSRATALALVKQARAHGAIISLDPSFHFSREFGPRPYEVLSELDYVFPNLDEARALSGVQDAPEAAAIIRALGPQTVVIKMGAEGCYVESARIRQMIPAVGTARVVDTTGAGDAFCGAFLTAMLWGFDDTDAARIGNAVASQVVTRVSGHHHAPTLAELTGSGVLNPSLSERLDKIRRVAQGKP